jgi:inorganic pyrophosphatase
MCMSSWKRPAGAERNLRTTPNSKPSFSRKYPHDWGFVPSTKADDGDPLDIMVIHDAATFPGIVLTCRIIGVLQIEQKSKGKAERNDRLFAVPRRSHSRAGLARCPGPVKRDSARA